MFYTSCVLAVFLGTALFFYWRRVQLSQKFLNCLTIQIHYRFQNLYSQYSGNGRSKNGALIFKIERKDHDIRNVVLKEVKLERTNFIINLDQLIMITFLQDSDLSHEASVRFRIKRHQKDSTKSKQHYVFMSGYLTSELSGRVSFRLRVPVSMSQEEVVQIKS